MLGAAEAQTTVGLNFQQWYYDSGNNPQTIGFNNGYSDYNTTGFPVTDKAFGVALANWSNTDPMGSQYNANPVNQACTFGGTATTFAGGLTCYVDAPLGAHASGAGELQSLSEQYHYPTNYMPGLWTPPGDDEVLWGNIVGNNANPFSVSVSGLAAKFPHGYVIQSVAAVGESQPTMADVIFTDGTTTNTATYHIWHIKNNPGSQWPSSTAGISDCSGTFTADTLNIDSATNAPSSMDVPHGVQSALAGFILTDEPVISLDPQGGTFITNSTISLSATVAALPNALAYQWLSNGVPVLAATNAAYTITGATVADSANYELVVTNLYGSATSGVATVTVAAPATLTWDANTSTTGAQDGSGDWAGSLTENWWNGTDDVAWSPIDNAIFGIGGTGDYTVTVTDTNAPAVNSLTFNSGNYTLSGDSLTLAGFAQINANTNATIDLALAGTAGLVKNGSGTLTLNAEQSYNGVTMVNDGLLVLAYNNGASGTLQGSLVINSNATVLTAVNNALGYNGSGNWVQDITLNFGTLKTAVTTDNGWGTIINMIGGTMGTTVAGGYFAMGDQPVFNVTGTNVPSVISANLTVREGTNSIVFNVTRGTAAVDLEISGNLLEASTNGITLDGGGILELSGGDNSYTGQTIVSNGTLIVAGQLTGGGAVTLNDATALNVTANALNTAITTASLTLGASGTSTNTLGFADLASLTVPPITVSGSLAVANPVTVNISGAIPATGQYPLIQYSGESPQKAFKLGSLPPGVSATLVDDHSSSVYLNVTATPVQTEVWSGTSSGTWDIDTTANWTLNGSTAKWFEYNIATFDDTASGTTAITLNTNVHPANVIFTNNTKAYSITGSGSIAGSAGLALIGAGTVTLGTSNSYAGGSVIDAGTLSVSADDNLGTGPLVLNGGTLDIAGAGAFTSAKSISLNGNSTIQVDNSTNAAFGSAITGVGALTKAGNGTLTLSAKESYTGGTTVNGGLLVLAYNNGSSGTLQGNLIINSNATVLTAVNNALGYNGSGNWVQDITLNFGTLNTAVATDNGWGTAINMIGGTMGTTVSGGYFAMGDNPVIDVTGTNVPSVISANLTDRDPTDGISFTLTRGTAAVDLEVSGNVLEASAGGITVAGNGIMELAGNNNTYTGGTEVQSSSTLILSGRLVGGGSVTVDDGATLDLLSGTAANIISTNPLTLGSSGALTLGFGNVNSSTIPLASVSDLVVNDAITVNITGNISLGEFPLIKYSGTLSGSGAFTLGHLPTGVSATLATNLANQSLDLVVTSAPLSFITDLSSGTNYQYTGSSYTLTVVAGGNPTLGYQWYHNGTLISGATTTTLTLTRLSTASDGGYYVIVTNASGSISSSTNHLVVLPISGYPALAIATQPVAFWPLDESAGPTAVDTMGNHNASYSSSGVTYGVQGPVGTNLVAVNGSSGQISCPYFADLNPAGPFTAEAWLNPASVTSSLICAFASVHAASPRAGWLVYESTAGWEFRTYNQNSNNVAVDISGGTPTAGTWNHVAVVWDGSKGYIYVNGVLANTSAATNFVANSDSPLTVGSRSDSAYYWSGSVGDVAVYDRALTPEEIKTHALNAPALAITPSAGDVILSWVPTGGGTLQASSAVTGPYTNVPAATTPWTNSPTGDAFYRVSF
jgi:autotransporter-associated beta strand protein